MTLPPHLQQLADRNQAEVNARDAAAGLCVMHNTGEQPPAKHLATLANGNVLPLCDPCLTWWQIEGQDPGIGLPVSVTPITA